MKPAMFREMTHVLGAPPDWKPEEQGECLGLPVAIDQAEGSFTSCWTLEPEDVARICAGGKIYLTVLGAAHPPVRMKVRNDDR